ncbi:MAG: asparagine synthase-related protein [Acidobacteriota bacterium]
MSRIAGIMNPEGEKIVSRMLQKMKHKDTTDSLIWEGFSTTLGANGLKSIKEKAGPLKKAKTGINIVIDGRINHSERLSSEGKSKKTNTEKILDTYSHSGIKLFDKLEGEFALSIAEKNRLILARDPLGIKPLYYGFKNSEICFASEIKALVDFVDEVKEFPPGHFMLSDLGIFPLKPFMPESVSFEAPMDSVAGLYDCLIEAVQRALPASEVEVGVWLSGGVDSSAVAALARNFVGRLHTVSAGIKGAPDLKYARLVAEHIGAEHHERLYTMKEMLAVLDKVIYHLEAFDAPLVRSAIGNYLVAELASEYVPFVFSGEGGDELFAGYDYQKDCQGEVELTLCIQDAISSLHNTALQRVDRSASAHGTQVTTPFLDPDVVRYALAIPARWKIREPEGTEKWPLRKALTGHLPEEIIWREKEKFWQGAGVWDMLAEYAEEKISDQEFTSERELGVNFHIRSKEELLYYRIFKSFFGNKVPLEEIGRTQHI